MDLNKFFKKLEELNFIDDEGRIQVSLKGVKDWPSNLDTENFEIDIVSNGDDKDGEGYIAGWAGGDWQEMARNGKIYNYDSIYKRKASYNYV